jgi:hypothetical protein
VVAGAAQRHRDGRHGDLGHGRAGTRQRIASRPGLRLNAAMPELTRRRYPERPDCWHVYYGDVQVGTIAARAGNPHDTNPWEWSCGFYPGEHQNGTAATFDDARAEFEQAWRVFLSTHTEADFQEWREARAWTAWKYKMWDTGHRLPTQLASGRSKCFCGADITIRDMGQHARSVHTQQIERTAQ